MGQRFCTINSTSNLLRDGDFELLDSEGTPAFWVVGGAVENDQGSTNISFETDETLKGGIGTYADVRLSSDKALTLSQYFGRVTGTFDFVAPLDVEARRSDSAGYQNDTDTLLGAGFYTVSMSILLTEGELDVTVFARQADGTTPETFVGLENGLTRRVVGSDKFQRVTLNMYIPQMRVDYLEIQFQRSAASNVSSFRLSHLTMAPGTYTSVAFLPCPFKSTFPKGAIVLSMGETCPAGFEDIKNGEYSPLSEWAQNNPNSQGRRGNFPRNSSDLTGSEMHTTDTPGTVPDASDTLKYPTKNNKYIQSLYAQDEAKDVYEAPTVDLPGSDNGAPTHVHELSPSSTRPVAWPFLLCKRL